MKKKIKVLGIDVRVNQDEYISLTDIAKNGGGKPHKIIPNWLKNNKTLLFLEAWEEVHKSNSNLPQMREFRMRATGSESYDVSPKRYIKETGAIGIVSKSGRHGGGTFAHIEIAIAFAYWLEPRFQVFFLKEFNRMKEKEAMILENTKTWALDKMITDSLGVYRLAEFAKELQTAVNPYKEEEE